MKHNAEHDERPTSDPYGKKTALAPLLKGIVFVIAGILNFSMAYAERYWSIVIIVVGLVYMVIAIKRRTD